MALNFMLSQSLYMKEPIMHQFDSHNSIDYSNSNY